MFIPKEIHYCWFGGNPLPPLAQKCIASWEKFFPDYEIIRWDEFNYDVNKIPYIQEAYEARKYAFVSDYARFDILYHHGGLYFDTDVEVIKNFGPIIHAGPFMGCEKGGGSLSHVAPGLGIGALPEMSVYKELLEIYRDRHFRNPDGSYDHTTIVEITTALLTKYGFNAECKDIQKCADFYIYPPEFFSPRNGVGGRYRLSEKTYSIHHYAASWMSSGGKIRAKLSKLIGYDNYNALKRLIGK